MNMEYLTVDRMVVDGVDKYRISELKRVYGSVVYDGEEFVFLYEPESEDTTRAYRRGCRPCHLCQFPVVLFLQSLIM